MVGEASTAEGAMTRVPSTRPDVAVLDVRLPDGDGIGVCRDLILTSDADDEALFAAIMAGAIGYVLKQIRGAELVTAVRRVGAGESLFDSAFMESRCFPLHHSRISGSLG